MKCEYQNTGCRYVDTATMTKDKVCTECELFNPNKKTSHPLHNTATIFIILVIILIGSMLCSCSKRLHSAHETRIHSNAAYCALYYQPYHKHSPNWYKRHTPTYRYHPIQHDKLPKHGKTN
jgi:hypothetical protein